MHLRRVVDCQQVGTQGRIRAASQIKTQAPMAQSMTRCWRALSPPFWVLLTQGLQWGLSRQGRTPPSPMPASCSGWTCCLSRRYRLLQSTLPAIWSCVCLLCVLRPHASQFAILFFSQHTTCFLGQIQHEPLWLPYDALPSSWLCFTTPMLQKSFYVLSAMPAR